MDQYLQMLITVVCAVLASSGFWAYIQHRREKKDLRTQMLIGLGHDRIITLGTRYIERGYITQPEYENLFEYLYKPYKALGGNGSAERISREVDKLPIKDHDTDHKEDDDEQ